MIERVAPAILELLADGVPRPKPAIVAALAGQHDRQDVVHALIRLAVTGRVEETGGRYALADDDGRGLSPAQVSQRQARPTTAISQAAAKMRQASVPCTRASVASSHTMSPTPASGEAEHLAPREVAACAVHHTRSRSPQPRSSRIAS